MSAPTPTIIAGRYELQRRLAQGGMAEVWLAVDLTLDRRVAVKWLKPTLATDEVVAERFRREAKAAASLDHANIVAVYDVFEQDGRQAVVMQLVDGKSLRQLLDTQKRLSPELTCHIGSAVAAALDHAHGAGFVHRDVKPGNIMITPDGRVLLTDFGIAKGLHGESGDDLTSDNIMMGTAKYLSPEQVRGKKLDGRADLYSLGLVLYECLAGRVPFLGESDADTALARLQRDPTDLARLRATLPTRLVNVIHDLLARNPDKRPATGEALILELKAASAEGPPEIDPTDAERSPVAPFSAGRLMRAPSDLRGRSKDRDRGRQTPTPPRGKHKRGDSPSRPTPRPGDRRPGRAAPHPSMQPESPSRPIDPMLSGPVAIPGEPPHITGRNPVTPTTTTSVAPTRTPKPEAAPVRDGTPPAGITLRGAPAKGLGQKWGPSLTLVGTLVAVAVVLVIILWAALEFGGGDTTTTTTVLPADQLDAAAPAVDEPADASADAPVGDTPVIDADDAVIDTGPVIDPSQASIVSTVTFDPEGDLRENDDTVDLATDGDPSTTWRTSCYSNEFMGAKNGVGIVVSFDTPIARSLSVALDHGPYIVKFYGAIGDEAPTTFDDWGAEVDLAFGDTATTITSAAPVVPVSHMLVLIQQLGRDDGCSENNPFRGGISEIALA
jgi:serine/threonine-protein kinase